jgi:hypothetical protein
MWLINRDCAKKVNIAACGVEKLKYSPIKELKLWDNARLTSSPYIE